MYKAGIKESTILVIIDPQRDFMDVQGASLPVPGATADMARLSGFIRRETANIDTILVTLDTHSPLHIAHAVRWVDRDGNHPAPFTEISVEQVESGMYRAADPEYQNLQLAYVRALRTRGNKTLMIWPPHCIRDTNGYKIVQSLGSELQRWHESTGRRVLMLNKGTNSHTEQYGAFGPEVEVPGVIEAEKNERMIKFVQSFDRQIWAGEALSHCVMASFDQVPWVGMRIILTDATSPVTGFEQMAKDWLAAKRKESVHLMTTTDLFL